MDVSPEFSAFEETYDAGRPQLVWSALIADIETPVSAFLKLAANRPYGFLLESVTGGAVRGRYSIIGFDPDLVWRTEGATVSLSETPEENPGSFKTIEDDPIAALRALITESQIDFPDALPPMSAGVFGYLGYDMVRHMERLGEAGPDALGVPDAVLMRPRLIAVFDSITDQLSIVTPVFPKDSVNAKDAYNEASARLETVVFALDRPLERGNQAAADESELKVTSNTTPAEYMEMVARAKEYIAAGDIFQVVLSQRFEAPFELPPFSLYRALRRTNPSPYLYFLNLGDFSMAGSSPEILVSAKEGTVTIRPIAGTRPRGANATQDHKHAADLLADPKERAEHLMLLDLGRNDVGRVAEIGTVKVTDQFFIEYYSHVMHIVSNVEGKLAADKDALDALIGGFPAGTVSGAPKVRAMEIIDELEKEKRGPYAGCVGYFSADGTMDTCIVLRTSVIKDGKIYVQAGAGIVADSDPEAEQTECENKAKALFTASEEALRIARPGANWPAGL